MMAGDVAVRRLGGGLIMGQLHSREYVDLIIIDWTRLRSKTSYHARCLSNLG